MTSPQLTAIAMSVRSDFSFGESSFQIGQIIETAKERGYSHVAVCDFMTISGAPEFTSKAHKAGLTPIVGVVINVVDQPQEKIKDKDNGAFRIKVFPKDELGMQSIYRLLSKGLTPENFYYVPRVGIRDVLALENVVVTSGDLRSIWHTKKPTLVHRALSIRFGQDYYTELVAIDTPLFDRVNRDAIEHVNAHGGKLIVTRPAMYASTGHALSTDVLRAIMTNDNIDSKWLARPYSRDLTLLPAAEQSKQILSMLRRTGATDLKTLAAQVGNNTKNLAAGLSYDFQKLQPCMPKMADDEFAALVDACKAGWRKRFESKVWGHVPGPEEMEKYKERLTFELGVIRKMGFSGYFLLVQEIVQWSKNNGILVGPGRGSVGGSLIAYLMYITDVDPIRFNLLFERFINPDRVDLPDADLDFMSARRHEVISYLVNKYGQDRVAGIVNFSTLQAAGALRDSARIYNLSPFDYACSKQMEKEHGVNLSLSESADRVPDI
ncbi:PHP domain-containing protein, partial [Comamonas thiooxydans]|uniref:PHP domain-containing protein n=1 Tax=Comamonas thiooxydans TaxID=363952 RepID=UPI000AB3401A